VAHSTIPAGPPFALRASLLTPLAAGGYRYEPDARVDVDAQGRLAAVEPWSSLSRTGAPDGGAGPMAEPAVVDLRPWVLLPGMVDLHLHLPQLPSAGLGAGLDLLTWLERYIFPLERAFDRPTAERIAPAAFRAMAAAGTTTALMYGAVYEPSLDAAFEAAEAHGMRAVIGKVMMDRLRYDPVLPQAIVLETSLRQTADLIGRWHGRDRGRLRYAVTPRFAVSCSAEMLREAAALARDTGAYLQTHLAEDQEEIEEVRRLFPDARDYTDVYDRAGVLGEHAILAHAIHLSDREIARLADSASRVAHCPSSNLFLASGTMRLARYLAEGLAVGLGSDVSGGPDLSLFGVMRSGAYTQSALRSMRDDPYPGLTPLEWLRLGSLDGARALRLEDEIGSIEPGKEADLIAVDADLTAPLPDETTSDAEEIASRLIFRAHPQMVRVAWVRGRRLDGPPNG
jgi:guanine deaminase